MVVKDPVELFVAQNVALDGLLYPLVPKPSSMTCSPPGRHAGRDADPVHDRLVLGDQTLDRRDDEDRRGESARTRNSLPLAEPVARSFGRGAGAGRADRPERAHR